VKRSFIRAAVSALVVTPVAALGFWMLLHSGPKPGTDGFPIFTLVVAMLLGCVVGAIGAVVTFAFSQYPHSAKVGAIFASAFCLLFTGMGIYSDLQDGKAIEAGPLFFIWLLVWPIGFLVSLWVDLKHFVAKSLLAGVTKE